jgi:hypothetical protein
MIAILQAIGVISILIIGIGYIILKSKNERNR